MAIASSSSGVILEFDVAADDVDEDVVAPPFVVMRDCSTWCTLCGRMLLGSAVDGLALLISLRRFDDIPEMYASLSGRCGLCVNWKTY